MENPMMKEFDVVIAQQKSEMSLLQSVIDNLPASVYWKNLEGVYLGCNRYAAEKTANASFPVEIQDWIKRNDPKLFFVRAKRKI